LFARVSEWERREAIRWIDGRDSRRYTYQELVTRVSAVAALLARYGLSQGDRLVLWAANRPEWVITFWAAQRLGIVVIPVDPGYSPAFLQRIQIQVASRLLVHDRDRSPGICPHEIHTDRVRACTEPESDFPAAYPEVAPGEIAEIVFTSGTTREPRGVVLRHHTVCGNLRFMSPEFDRYRPWTRLIQPLRILSLLPLGHMFGQTMSLFVPILLGGSAVLADRALPPWELVEVLRKERVSVLVGVPRMLQQLREYLERDGFACQSPVSGTGVWGILRRWIRYHRLHRALGFKFWAVVAGGATVPHSEEDFWARVGILLIQGYGLTEAGPIVALNHPFSIRRGSVGRILPGQEVRIAADGEILVRGSNISTEYIGMGRQPEEEGWLHTGDLGSIDGEGRLYFLGRKAEVIVTGSGANVYPEDVEAVLEAQAGIRMACVVGRDPGQGEVVHAVFIPDEPPPDLWEIVNRVNQLLEPHQRIQSWGIWPEPDFPRTESTLKVKRIKVKEAVSSVSTMESAQTPEQDGLDELVRLVSDLEQGGQVEAHRLDELGLSSLDRVELLIRLERRAGRRLQEGEFTSLKTVGEVRGWLSDELVRDRQGRPWPTLSSWPWKFPWAQVRSAFQHLFCHLIQWGLQPEVNGIDYLPAAGTTVVFTANHTSHLDTPVLLACLPVSWRNRLVPAARLEFFEGRFFPERTHRLAQLRDRLLYFLARLLFQILPLPQRSGGMGAVLDHSERLAARGCSVLIFPEGMRRSGEPKGFKPGAVLLARHLGVPLVPVYLEGLSKVLPPHRYWPTQAPVTVWFGPPRLASSANSLEDATSEYETFYRQWWTGLKSGVAGE
jgi:long-chain acyl-CoA synthetase